MGKACLALVWHQHQPFYRDLVTGRVPLPWVRLHAVKDYWGMAALLDEFPEVRACINLTPCMLAQLDAYLGGGSDDVLDLARKPAAELAAEEAERLLEVGFWASWDRMVRPHARYGELLAKRGHAQRSAARARREFSAADLRDLQVWMNLVWFHPFWVERDEAIRALLEKGRDFSEDEKAIALERQHAAMAEVVPLHKKLAERGQVELTTTPWAHPILPLLADPDCASVAMPGVRLAKNRAKLTEDAREHVRRAVESHAERFGERPVGVWPAEGGVSEEIVPLLAAEGVRWIATDEEILSYSIESSLEGPERAAKLYRPWRVESDGAAVDVLFRDHSLADAIGFRYQHMDARRAANDFIGHLAGIAKASDGEALVPVVLDGENAWEHYPEQGAPFLRELYGRLSEAPNVSTARVRDWLESHPERETLPRLFPGSWIGHDFYIWAGHREDRIAWERLYRVREDLVRLAAGRAEHDESARRAWESLYAAEGSDWFWWYGDDRSSGMDETYDTLFRGHLKNVYRALSERPPAFLDEAILERRGAQARSNPRALLRVTLDGRATDFFEWQGAGCYRPQRGAMAAAGAPGVRRVFYGFDLATLYVRVDFADAERAHEGKLGVRLVFLSPPGATVEVSPLDASGSAVKILGAPRSGEGEEPQAAFGHVLELACPFARLGRGPGASLAPGDEIAFYVLLLEGADPLERVPAEGLLAFSVPGPDFEASAWSV